MTASRNIRLLCRWLMLAVLALGLAWQPVLAAVSEIHALQHDASSVHDANGERVASSEQDDTATVALHQLHHFAHCCGHAIPMPLASLMTTFRTHDEPTRLADSPFVPSDDLRAPFRPPIAA